MAASFPKDIALDVTIVLAVIIFCTAIYIGCLLYKRKKIRKSEEDLENIGEIQKGLELELVESLHEETKTNTPKGSQSTLREKENQSLSITNSNSLKVISKQSSLQNSSNSSKSDSRNSSIIDSTNGHKKKASKKGSTNDSINGYSSTNSTRMSSINDSMNGYNPQRKGSIDNMKGHNSQRKGSIDNMKGHNSQRKGSIDNMKGYNSQRKGSIDNMNGYNSQRKGSIDINGHNPQRKGSVNSFSSKRDPKLPSLVIKPQKNTPPPPPPSPLKSQNDSVDSLSKMMPSYVSDYTYSPPLSSKASMLSKPESRSD